jgi:hypothetical protein
MATHKEIQKSLKKIIVIGATQNIDLDFTYTGTAIVTYNCPTLNWTTKPVYSLFFKFSAISRQQNLTA